MFSNVFNYIFRFRLSHVFYRLLLLLLLSFTSLVSTNCYHQAIYGSNSGCDAEKLAWLQGELLAMVDRGQLTAPERAAVAADLEAQVTATKEELAVATAENKPKKVCFFVICLFFLFVHSYYCANVLLYCTAVLLIFFCFRWRS